MEMLALAALAAFTSGMLAGGLTGPRVLRHLMLRDEPGRSSDA